ncbi:beta-N-acetylhexosaminidase [Draconibacterium sediminis]|uniref:beta-N-acetylhexosaminidase n=1 Tax=Draconibacterium sediminis TaxID=1544798 RepID=A0A0D8JFQ1_9BACT|nr:beta-N-acetylhexosaminidase [Draconibacterium sediminis]KJF45386.1 glycoside hydrolase family 20 [Draconibacterium sediminis]
MKLIRLAFFVLALSTKSVVAQNGSVIPQPLNVEQVNVEFIIDSKTIIVADDANQANAHYLQKLIESLVLSKPAIKMKGTKGIILKLDESLAETLGDEGYLLETGKNSLAITAPTTIGIFYGIQTLRQLMNKNSGVDKRGAEWLVEGVRIEDKPRFKWRAYMLDESRYFMGEAFVKKILDQMALLKMNVFHWHLTDDAGWRMEIKKYPLLTEIGAFRDDSEIEGWGSGKTAGEPHGGFYTQEQMKDIVTYAAERNITVVPEFEMPGHSSAAIAAYTWLGTAGKDIDVPVKFGRHYDNYDVTKPEVFQFVKDVLGEMFEIFPSEVIHIGGDEVGYKVWEESEHVQKYMKEKGIKTPADLQIAFTNQISNFIEQQGRRMMGWNEIMGKNVHQGFEEKKDDKDAETSLAPNVIVHFWKGDLGLATEAAKKGYGIVNALHSNTYLDYGYKSISLEKAYAFNPIPEGLDEKFHENIYGLGCQMWTEWTPTYSDVERQTFPRIAAYAEVGWTNNTRKNYKVFRKNLNQLLNYWKGQGIGFAEKFEEKDF